MLGFVPLASAPLADDEGFIPSGTVVTIFLTSGSSWFVPDNWNSSANIIEVIGGGGSGGVARSTGTSAKATGGGAGGYSRIANLALTGDLCKLLDWSGRRRKDYIRRHHHSSRERWW